MPESPTSQRRLKAYDMSLQALEFRKMGASYSAICAQLMDPDTDPQVPYYKSRQAVQMAVKSILKRTAAEPAAERAGPPADRGDGPTRRCGVRRAAAGAVQGAAASQIGRYLLPAPGIRGTDGRPHGTAAYRAARQAGPCGGKRKWSGK